MTEKRLHNDFIYSEIIEKYSFGLFKDHHLTSGYFIDSNYDFQSQIWESNGEVIKPSYWSNYSKIHQLKKETVPFVSPSSYLRLEVLEKDQGNRKLILLNIETYREPFLSIKTNHKRSLPDLKGKDKYFQTSTTVIHNLCIINLIHLSCVRSNCFRSRS